MNHFHRFPVNFYFLFIMYYLVIDLLIPSGIFFLFQEFYFSFPFPFFFLFIPGGLFYFFHSPIGSVVTSLPPDQEASNLVSAAPDFF